MAESLPPLLIKQSWREFPRILNSDLENTCRSSVFQMPTTCQIWCHTSLCFTFTKTQKRTHFKAEETQSQRDSVICKAITWSEYLNLHSVGHITNLIFKCNVIIQRDAALNSYFKLFLNFYRNHLGACVGYPGPQITFKWSVQIHLEVYSTLI